MQVVMLMGSGIVLARLLTPEDFGLFAMAISLTAFVREFWDFGLPMATVHREGVDHRQASVLFWVGMRLNLLTTVFLACMAPVVAWFYGDERLTSITMVIAVALFGLGLSYQHESLLIRQMRFGVLSLIDAGSLLIGFLVGAGSAWLGAGYWALVHQFASQNLARSAAIWFSSGWQPARNARHADTRTSELREILSYGRQYTGSRILAHVGRNLDRVLIGYFSGATAVGLYDNAFRWSRYPFAQVQGSLSNVVVAGLSRVQNDPKEYRESCRSGFLPVFTLVLPALAFMAIEARNVILVLLGEQWLGAVPFFQLLCVAALGTSVSQVTRWLYLSQGQTRRLFRWTLISTPFLVGAVALGIRWGALGVAIAYTIATLALTYPTIAFCLRTSYLSGRDFLAIVWRPAFASAVAAVVTAISGLFLVQGGALHDLSIKLPVFGLSYVLTWTALPGGSQASKDVRRLLEKLTRSLPRAARNPR